MDENSLPAWGKMNIYQILKHCILFEEMILGKKKYKRSFLGLLFGKLALKGLTKDETPIKRNMPTFLDPIIRKEGNIAAERMHWISLINEYAGFSNDNFIHPFFGKMTKEEIGYFAYKHSDHHLRQFNS